MTIPILFTAKRIFDLIQVGPERFKENCFSYVAIVYKNYFHYLSDFILNIFSLMRRFRSI